MEVQKMLGDGLESNKNQVADEKKTIPTASLFVEGKYVGLYFSAHWCPPCRAFTPKLAEFYKKLNQDKNLEIVFVSSDRDEESFKSYFNEMPWLSLPYDNRKGKEELSKLFKVQGIPTFVVLDGATGDVITTDGRTAVTNDPKGTEFPWKPKPFSELFQGNLLNGVDGDTVTCEEAAKGKVLGLYFSGHWCPPCRQFTPKLIDTYSKLKEQGKKFEVVFVSSDRSESTFKEYYATMPWLAWPYSEEPRRKSLSEHFKVQGIPTLIIVDEELEVITTHGRGAVAADPNCEMFPWKPEPLSPLNDSTTTCINETPTLLYLTGGDEQNISQAQECLKDIATQYREKVKESKRGKKPCKDLVFLYEGGDESAELAESVREFLNIDDVPKAVIIDILGQGKCVQNSPTKENLGKLIDDYEKDKLQFESLR